MNIAGIIVIASRNVIAMLSKRAGLLSTITLAFLVFSIGSILLDTSNTGLALSYRNSMTADLSLSSTSEVGFGILGGDVPLQGIQESIPPLSLDQAVIDAFTLSPFIQDLLPLYTGPAVIDGMAHQGGDPKGVWLFGADLASYFDVMEGIKITEGSLPAQGEASFFFPEEARSSTIFNGQAAQVGQSFLLTTAKSGSFTIREVTLAGYYSYPSKDMSHSRIALVDAGTAAELFGIAGSGTSDVQLDPGTLSIINADLDSLFLEDPSPSTETVPQILDQKTDSIPIGDQVTAHFFLLKAKPGTDIARLSEEVRTHFDSSVPVQVRTWRETAGGLAQISWFISILFTLGIWLVIAIIMFVVVNSLALEVYERSFEIGTIRALGGHKTQVMLLFVIESVLTVGTAGIFGVVLGVVLAQVLTSMQVPLTNPLLASLFGSDTLQLIPDPLAILLYGLSALATSILAALYPVFLAVRIPPVHAMRRA